MFTVMTGMQRWTPVFIKKKTAELNKTGNFNKSRPKSLLTIHNMAFQGHCSRQYLSILGLDDFSIESDAQIPMVSFMSLGIAHADRVSTVSPTYADEILSEEFGCGLETQLAQCGVRGILNGVDYNVWHPQSDAALNLPGYRFDSDARARIKTRLQKKLDLRRGIRIPLLSITNRLTHQKMADVVIEAIPHLMKQGVQIVAMGEGQDEYVEQFQKAANKYKGQFSYTAMFTEVMEHRIHAGADICLSPSRFEPCGLNPLYAMRYGSVPVVRATGGLCDTVVHASDTEILLGRANGVVFNNVSKEGLLTAIDEALKLFRNRRVWTKLQQNCMGASFLWQRAASEYCEIYSELASEELRITQPVEDVQVIGSEAAIQNTLPPLKPVVLPFAPLLNAVGSG